MLISARQGPPQADARGLHIPTQSFVATSLPGGNEGTLQHAHSPGITSGEGRGSWGLWVWRRRLIKPPILARSSRAGKAGRSGHGWSIRMDPGLRRDDRVKIGGLISPRRQTHNPNHPGPLPMLSPGSGHAVDFPHRHLEAKSRRTTGWGCGGSGRRPGVVLPLR